ncbi:hypothetical protein RJ55_04896 [Drechmeria coniospora]|nr:hypothetical protein RJ55_04896 [Drechmeria coniospora]
MNGVDQSPAPPVGKANAAVAGAGAAAATRIAHPRHVSLSIATAVTAIFVHEDKAQKPFLGLKLAWCPKATFFVTGRNFGKGAINDPNTPWPALIKRMVADGHQVASHTWSHQRLTDLGWRAFHQQIIYNEIALANILGFFPTYLRPPYSASNERTDRWLGELGYHVTYFNLDTKGYLHDSPGLIQESKNIWDENVDGRNPTETTWLGVEHDPIYQTAHNLTKHMLESLYKNGFRAVTVGECLGDPKEYWYRNLFDS